MTKQINHETIYVILLYNTENVIALSNRKQQKFTQDTIPYASIRNVLDRHFLKYIIGTSKSFPNMAVYGEMGEIPLSLKSHRLMLKLPIDIETTNENKLEFSRYNGST